MDVIHKINGETIDCSGEYRAIKVSLSWKGYRLPRKLKKKFKLMSIRGSTKGLGSLDYERIN